MVSDILESNSAPVGVTRVATVAGIKNQIAMWVTVIMAIATIGAYVFNAINEAQSWHQRMGHEVTALRKELQQRTDQRWRFTDQLIFAHQLKNLNPELTIPMLGPMSPTGASYPSLKQSDFEQWSPVIPNNPLNQDLDRLSPQVHPAMDIPSQGPNE